RPVSGPRPGSAPPPGTGPRSQRRTVPVQLVRRWLNALEGAAAVLCAVVAMALVSAPTPALLDTGSLGSLWLLTMTLTAMAAGPQPAGRRPYAPRARGGTAGGPGGRRGGDRRPGRPRPVHRALPGHRPRRTRRGRHRTPAGAPRSGSCSLDPPIGRRR